MAARLIILGGGRMGAALAEGLLAARWCEPAQLTITSRTLETRAALEERFPGVEVVASIEQAQVDEAPARSSR